MRDVNGIALSDTLVADHTWCYDLNYNRDDETPFVTWAIQHGAKKALDGVGMLVEQAAESFFLWRGVKPQTEPVINEMRARLAATHPA